MNIGDSVTFTLVARNDGPFDATSVVISDPLPSGLSYVSSTPTCAVRPVSGVLDCTIGALPSGASSTVTVVAKAQPESGNRRGRWSTARRPSARSPIRTSTAAPAGTLVNTARTSSAVFDDDPSNDQDQSATLITKAADLAQTETASVASGATGDTLTSTLSTRDNGPDDAAGVTVTDVLPGGVTFVSKVEQQIDLNPGETKTASVSCATGVMTDGSFRIDAVDQQTGTLASVHAIESEQIGDATWRMFTVDVATPTTTAFSIRCMSTQLDSVGGHTHSLRLSHPQTTATIAAGQVVEVQVSCADDAKGIVVTSDLAAGLINTSTARIVVQWRRQGLAPAPSAEDPHSNREP